MSINHSHWMKQFFCSVACPKMTYKLAYSDMCCLGYYYLLLLALVVDFYYSQGSLLCNILTSIGLHNSFRINWFFVRSIHIASNDDHLLLSVSYFPFLWLLYHHCTIALFHYTKHSNWLIIRYGHNNLWRLTLIKCTSPADLYSQWKYRFIFLQIFRRTVDTSFENRTNRNCSNAMTCDVHKFRRIISNRSETRGIAQWLLLYSWTSLGRRFRNDGSVVFTTHIHDARSERYIYSNVWWVTYPSS